MKWWWKAMKFTDEEIKKRFKELAKRKKEMDEEIEEAQRIDDEVLNARITI